MKLVPKNLATEVSLRNHLSQSAIRWKSLDHAMSATEICRDTLEFPFYYWTKNIYQNLSEHKLQCVSARNLRPPFDHNCVEINFENVLNIPQS
jgi:hypothetical protein